MQYSNNNNTLAGIPTSPKGALQWGPALWPFWKQSCANLDFVIISRCVLALYNANFCGVDLQEQLKERGQY